MKEKIGNKKMPSSNDFETPFFELDENQEFDRSEYEEDNFYSFLAEDHNNLGEIIKNRESLRYVV